MKRIATDNKQNNTEITISSNGFDIVCTGSAILFNQDADLTFDINIEDFKFQIVIEFIMTEDGKRNISTDVSENILTMHCNNFVHGGTGTTIPFQIAQVHSKKLCIMLWSKLEGDEPNTEHSRVVTYTLYRER